MLTVASFVIAIGLLVAVHEWGHFAMARACGVKVLRFSVGFGTAAWSWVSPRSGTEFALCVLPLGGYVKMLDEREGPVDVLERHLAFNTQSLARRALIVLAGPLANLVFAVVLYSVVNWTGQRLDLASQRFGGALGRAMSRKRAAFDRGAGGNQWWRARIESRF